MEDRPAFSADQNMAVAAALFAALAENAPDSAMLIGGAATGSTSIDGTFNLTEVVETFVSHIRRAGQMRHMFDE